MPNFQFLDYYGLQTKLRSLLYSCFDIVADSRDAGRQTGRLDDYRCALYGDASRPKVCSDFKAEEEFCGRDRDEALQILGSLEGNPPSPLKGG
jgi:hypothetical protein